MSKCKVWGAALAVVAAFMPFATTGFLARAAHAETQMPMPDYEHYQDVPSILLHHLNGPRLRESYVAEVVEAFKAYSADGEKITKADIERIAKDADKAFIEGRDHRIKTFDADNDGKVTKEEFEAYILKRQYGGKMPENGRRKNAFDLKAAAFLSHDSNGDGFFDAQDKPRMPISNEVFLGYATHPQIFISQLMDKSGALTLATLRQRAEETFDAFDTDKDGALSDTERATFLVIHKKRVAEDKVKWALYPGRCTLPKLPAGVVLHIIPSIQGALSSVSIQDDTEATYAAEVVVSPDAPPTYLVLLSYGNNKIWRVTGATDRLKQVVILAPNDYQAPKRYAAITGVPKRRVHFAGLTDCAHDVGMELRSNNGKLHETVQIIEGATGGKAEVAALRGPLVRAEIGATGVNLKANRDITIGDAPAGYDPKIWRDYVQTFKQYLVKFSPEELAEIVTELPLIPYAVEPAGYGFAKLVHDGVLAPEPSGKKLIIIRYESGTVESKYAEHPAPTFPNLPIASTEERERMNWRVVRPMLQYPPMDYVVAGMYILEKGIPVSGGETYKCVMSEETGKPLASAHRCPKE